MVFWLSRDFWNFVCPQLVVFSDKFELVSSTKASLFYFLRKKNLN